MRLFWKEKELQQLNKEEWESLCDRCGQCCLIQLEDETGECVTTGVVCRYYDQTCKQCTIYEERQQLVPTCLTLTADNLEEAWFAPQTCAYRLLAEGKELPDWHPLITGSNEKMQKSGVSISGRVISEESIHPDELELHILPD